VSRLRTGRPLWLDRQGAPRLRTPKLEGHHATDVAIVGGGITGCACAYLLASRGVRVALLDAGEIGHGSTAASTALLMQEPDLDFRTLAARHGTRTARSIWDQSRGAVRSLVRAAVDLRRPIRRGRARTSARGSRSPSSGPSRAVAVAT
jgi:glycine/D-amino acid oxidase-like deaminating enzyme